MRTRQEQELRPLAEKLLNEHNLFKLPINIYGLVDALGVNLKEEDLEDDISGFLIFNKGKATIGVNKGHHINRLRFTIAHEIAHHQLHHEKDDDLFIDKKPTYFRNKQSSSGEQTQEIEANRFAAELLMPKALLVKKIKDDDIDLTDDFEIQSLASFLQVSEEALVIRLNRLGLIEV